MTAALSREVAFHVPVIFVIAPGKPGALAAETAKLARKVAEAQRAVDECAFGSFEYDDARRWRDAARAPLLVALGSKGFRPRMPRSRQPLPFFPALRRVHRPEVA